MKSKILLYSLIIMFFSLVQSCTSEEIDKFINNDNASASFVITSPSYPAGGTISRLYAFNQCNNVNLGQPDGSNYSPEIVWTNAPEGTQSFAITIQDLSSPVFLHWVVYNIPATVFSVAENASASGSLPSGAVETNNDFIDFVSPAYGYGGPCPPLGTHDYEIRVYALNTILPVGITDPHTAVDAISPETILASASITASYTAAL